MPVFLPELSPDPLQFPHIDTALKDPDGLLAMGGDLTPQRLIAAYQRGIFPWFEAHQPILWWSPSRRTVIRPDQIHISRSLKKNYRRQKFTISINRAFDQVIDACALPRRYTSETWITKQMKEAYKALHQQGKAHSVEVWRDGHLVGGLYGLYIGWVFCGESMFHTETDASKIAFAALGQHLQSIDGQLIDCQVHNSHLQSLGATEIDRSDFIAILTQTVNTPVNNDHWQAQEIALQL